MKKGMMILIFMLILIIGSAGVYAQEQILKTETGILVYNVATNQVDIYMKTEQDNFEYVESQDDVPLDVWRNTITKTEGAVYVSDPISKEEADTKIKEFGATPKQEPQPIDERQQEEIEEATKIAIEAAELAKKIIAETKHKDETGKDVTVEDTDLEKAKLLVTGAELPAQPAPTPAQQQATKKAQDLKEGDTITVNGQQKQIKEAYIHWWYDQTIITFKDGTEIMLENTKEVTTITPTPTPQPTPAPTPGLSAADKRIEAAAAREAEAIKALETDPNNKEKQEALVAAKQSLGDAISAKRNAIPLEQLEGVDLEIAQAEQEVEKTGSAYLAKKNPETQAAAFAALAKLEAAREKKKIAEQDVQIEQEKEKEAAKASEAAGKMSPEELKEYLLLGAKFQKVRAEEIEREKEAKDIAALDADLAQKIAAAEKEEDKLRAEVADARKKGLEETVKAKEEELKNKIAEREKLEKERSELSEAQIDYGKNVQMTEKLTADIDRIDNFLQSETAANAMRDSEKKVADARHEREEAERIFGLLKEQNTEYYEKARAIPEAERTPEQKELISSYEQMIKRETENIEAAKAKEAEAKAKLASTKEDIDALEKSKADNEKLLAELEAKGENLRAHNEIALIDKEITKIKTDLAAAIKNGDAKEKERLENDLKKKEREREKKQDDLNWKERNWGGRTIYLINKFMQGYEEYKGINQYSSLWMSDEELAKRRQNAALKFCNEIIVLANTACWQSKICDGLFPREPPASQNTLVTEIGVGGYTPAAAIQAEKSFPMPYAEAGKTKTKHVYKITYFIENPHMDRELTYYIELRGDRTFKSPESKLAGRTLEKMGGKEGKLGSDPMIFESEYNYENACIVFSPRILKANGGYTNEICSPIIQYSGAATRPYTLPPATLAAVQNSTGTGAGVSMAGA